jgi:hypothetical protein
VRGIISGADIYIGRFSEYVNYRRLENELLKVERSLEGMRIAQRRHRRFRGGRFFSEYRGLHSDLAVFNRVFIGQAQEFRVMLELFLRRYWVLTV